MTVPRYQDRSRVPVLVAAYTMVVIALWVCGSVAMDLRRPVAAWTFWSLAGALPAFLIAQSTVRTRTAQTRFDFAGRSVEVHDRDWLMRATLRRFRLDDFHAVRSRTMALGARAFHRVELVRSCDQHRLAVAYFAVQERRRAFLAMPDGRNPENPEAAALRAELVRRSGLRDWGYEESFGMDPEREV